MADALVNPVHAGPPRGGPSAGAAESQLIEAARGGSVAAAEELAGNYWPAAHRVAALIVGDEGIAEDLAQESMLRALRSLDRFDATRPFAPWLHRIVTNVALDWLRSPASRDLLCKEGEIVPLVAGTHAPTSSDPELATALGRLELEDRAAVVLRHALGYRATEVAEILGMPEGTVRSRVHRALARLRTDLEGAKSHE